MCAQVLDRQLSRGMSASDSAKVIRHGNTLPNSPGGRLANPPLQQIIQRATAIFEVALGTADPETEAKIGLATGLKDTFFDGLEAIVLDWFPKEPPRENLWAEWPGN